MPSQRVTVSVVSIVSFSGQSAIDDHGNIVGIGDFEAQGHQVFANLARVLAAGDATLPDVVKVTIFVADITKISEIVALRRQYFQEPYPADSLVEVSALSRPQLELEIEAIAIRRRRVGPG